eukprot:Nitzschia sp. Nitz4//scaffold222_size33694//21929//23230//NITZ4_007864-RA/size33694-processed-gene-0.10-mRNA-1//1//CDS//3329542597//2757//frame0
MEPLEEIKVGDSQFLGFCTKIQKESDAMQFRSTLQGQFPDAAHIPVVWKLANNQGYDEDKEPSESVGPHILPELQPGLAVVVVRYFQEKLLGVTCGRLPQCYRAVAKLSVHRFTNGKEVPLQYEIPRPTQNVYGLAAGDSEIIVNVVEDPDKKIVKAVLDELDFDGFRGAAGEVLPRLQNLQADLSDKLVPIYRYPGNYSGQQWQTFSWEPTSLKIKKAVEEGLQPLVQQTMNHCVTNYYRDGKDFIAHHTDKDLDLNREGVIVSVSLGDERVLELRRRQVPNDTVRVVLPHGSMLVIGPHTNQHFSHSILQKEGATEPRLSLTFRDVRTFLDISTGQFFGQGVETKTLSELRSKNMVENVGWFGGFCALASWFATIPAKGKSSTAPKATAIVGAVAIGILSLRLWSKENQKKKDEQLAREFFSKASLSGTKY